MCINEETSIITFVVGTIINLILLCKLYPNIKDKNYYTTFVVILSVWQYALFMQIPDTIAWNNIKKNKPNETASKLAAFLNLTQPIVTFIGMLFILNVKSYYLLIPAIIVIVIYVINILLTIKKFKYDVKPEKKCGSLNYSWGEHVSPVLYLIIFPLLFLVLPIKSVPINLIIFFGTLLISILVNYNCNPGSWWCWSIASAGLVNYLLIT